MTLLLDPTVEKPKFDNAKIKLEFQKAKTQLLMRHPFYATLLLNFDIIFTNTIPIAAADNKRVYINWEGLARMVGTKNSSGEMVYDERKIQFILAHEIMHIAFCHALYCRKSGYDPKLHNKAADFVINQMLIDNNVGTPPTYINEKGETVPNVLVDKEMVTKFNYDTMLIYNYLKENWKKVEIEYDGNLVFDEYIDPEDMSDDDIEKFKSDIKLKIAEASMSAKMQGRHPLGMEGLIDSFLKTNTPWEQQLQTYLTSYVESYERGYERFNRKTAHMGLMLPSNIQELGMKEIVIGMDTSGSTQPYLKRFANEINTIKDTYGIKIRVWYCDAALQREEVFDTDEPLVLHLKGGGGTDFSPFTDRMNELVANQEISPEALLIILTDLDGSFGEYCDCDVLWAVVGGNRNNVPYGDIIYIED